MRSIVEELKRWGPERPAGESVSPADADRYCRSLARSHYENFPLVSWLLPRSLHQHFYNVYAYCRWADDLADEIPETERSLELLDWWSSQLDDCYTGTASHPVFIALRNTIEEFQIPLQPFADLISAFKQDRRVAEYATFDDLLDYCRRSANPVGRLVLYLCRVQTPENVADSDSICTGLQLANFWQDINRDLEIGRVYLPLEDCARFGYDIEDLRTRTTNEAFLNLMRFEVDRAREYLRNGLPLIDRLPGRLQVDIDLFAHGGLKILDEIEAIGFRVWDVRPVVRKRHAAGLLLKCLARAVRRRLFGTSERRPAT